MSGPTSNQHTYNDTVVIYPTVNPQSATSFSVTSPWNTTGNPSVSSTPYNGKRKGTVLTVCDGFNPPMTKDNSVFVSGSPVVFDETYTGSFTIYMDVEEWLHIDDLAGFSPSDVTTIDGTDFPTIGGMAYPYGLPASYLYTYELGIAGGTAYAGITDTYGSLSSPYTLHGGEAVPSYFGLYETSGFATAKSASASVKDNTWGGSVSPAYSQNLSFPPYGTIVLSSDGVTTSMTLTGTGEVQCNFAAQASSVYSYAVDIEARSFNGFYPAGLPIQLQEKGASTTLVNANPSFSAVIQQQAYSCGGAYQLGGSAYSTPLPVASLDERCPIFAYIDPSVSSLGDDARDWRLPIQFYPWQALNLAQAPNVSIAANTAISSSSTLVTLTQTKLEGYRYLMFTATGSASGSPTITIGTKKYAIKVTSGGTANLIDLCPPIASLPSGFTQDERQTRNPLTYRSNLVSNPVDGLPIITNADPKQNGWLYGILEQPSSASIGGVGASDSFTLSGIKLGRHLNCQAAVLNPFFSDVLGWTSPTDNSYLGVDLWLYSDGKQIGPFPGRKHVVPTNGASPYYQYFALTDLAAMISYWPGWSASTIAPPGTYPSGVVGSSSPAMSLEPYIYSGTGWVDQTHLDPSSATLKLLACLKVDLVQTYPGCGDFTKAYGGTNLNTPVRMAKLMRAQGEGIVFNMNGTPATASVFATYVTGGASAGSGVPDVQGTYRTGSPFGYGNKLVKLGAGAHTVNLTWEDACRFRLSLLVAQGALPHAYDVSNHLRHGRVYESTSTMIVGVADNLNVPTFSDTDTGIPINKAQCRWYDGGSQTPLEVMYSQTAMSGPDTISFAQTYDDGASFQNTMTIATSSSYFDFENRASGSRWFYWVDMGTIYYQVIDATLTVVIPTTATNITDADDAPISVRESQDATGLWRMGLFYSASNSPTVVFAPDGMTFS